MNFSLTIILMVIGWVCGIQTGRCEAFQCQKSTPAFDVNPPYRQIGAFEPASQLEVGDFVKDANMYPVLFKLSNGQEIRALCRPEDLGKSIPKTSSVIPEASPVSSVRTASTDPSFPAIFQSVQSFQSDLWKWTPADFSKTHAFHGFRWLSQVETTESRSSQLLKFMESSVVETIVKFNGNSLVEIRMLFFNRGDAKLDIGEAQFHEKLSELTKAFDAWTAFKGLDAPISGNATDTKRKSWFKFPVRVDLEWNISRNVKVKEDGEMKSIPFRAEFLKATISSYDGQANVQELVKPNYTTSNHGTKVHQSELKERVKEGSEGDICLEGIPMVDQGDKGYCVVASMERVMRYYGLDIDQNELAKVANTQTSGGTNTDEMYKILKKLSGQFSLSVREIINTDFKDFLKRVDDYNRIAKGNQKITLPRSGTIYLDKVYEAMDSSIYKQSRLKKLNELDIFKKEIQTQISRGSPLLWSVMLGLVGETPAIPQSRGGHMRLIVGYNIKTSQIVYSDSWGASHAIKHMSMSDAFVITDGLYSVLPAAF